MADVRCKRCQRRIIRAKLGNGKTLELDFYPDEAGAVLLYPGGSVRILRVGEEPNEFEKDVSKLTSRHHVHDEDCRAEGSLL